MQQISNIAVGLVALLHIFFMLLEMFAWNRPVGRRVFGLDRDFAKRSASLAANQGLYNGFLAAGLIWSLIDSSRGVGLEVFFLGCVVVAGIFGALTASRSILWVQAFPGAIALVLVWLAHKGG